MNTDIYTLKTPEITVKITNFGARVLSFEYQGADCLYGPKTLDDLPEDTCYCGSICGRVANRIAGGSFVLDGQEYKLAVNNGPNHLHGGTKGFSDMPWTVEEVSDTRLVLSLVSPDGQENYPGEVTVRAIYTVEGRRLTLEMQGSTNAPTLLNLTNHAYWNLNGSGTIDTHCLQVNASAYTPMVANIPTGCIVPVEGTLYDLRRPAALGERNAPDAIAGGYDDNYVLPTTPGVKLAAVLTNGRRTLRVLTDAPGLQVYTGDYLPLKRGGVALEAQNFPDSPHHPHFPTIELRPGEIYTRTIAWEID
ncbi:MAG: galactose mutarotase [Akkermansia sp.]|nr:galactose mutarotase [Akkermansia sp.]MBR6576270.1 galactose mutarotase [Akkermansia sp.]